MIRSDIPRLRVPFAAASGAATDTLRGAWAGPLVRPDGSAARDRTRVELSHDGALLSLRFECEDRHIWGTYDKRDDPLWREETVELFLAPGSADPVEYFEFEVSPHGILFDARVSNPHSRREDLTVDPTWDCAGIVWSAAIDRARAVWRAELRVPLASLCGPDVPRAWRANLFRIERPAGEPAEYSCWSATHTDPPDFHKPAYFGLLELSAPGRRAAEARSGEQLG